MKNHLATACHGLPAFTLPLQTVINAFNFFFFFFFCFVGPHPWHIGGSQARGLIRATAVGLYHSHSNARSKLFGNDYLYHIPISQCLIKEAEPLGIVAALFEVTWKGSFFFTPTSFPCHFISRVLVLDNVLDFT